MMYRRVAAGVALTLVLAGCGDSADEAASDTTTTTVSEATYLECVQAFSSAEKAQAQGDNGAALDALRTSDIGQRCSTMITGDVDTANRFLADVQGQTSESAAEIANDLQRSFEGYDIQSKVDELRNRFDSAGKSG